MKKLFFGAFFILLLLGCYPSIIGDLIHDRYVTMGEYSAESKIYTFTVIDTEKLLYRRPGMHGNWAYEKQAVHKIDIALSLKTGLEDTTAEVVSMTTMTAQQAEQQEYGSEGWYFYSDYGKKSECELQAPNTKYPFDSQETTHFQLQACSDYLEVTDKRDGSTCRIDLNPFNEKYTQSSFNEESPLSTQFDYALQDEDGSVIVRDNNWAYVEAGKIEVYRLACNAEAKVYSLSTEGMGEKYFILKVSHYGEPTFVLQYDNWKNNRIVSLSNMIFYDGPLLESGWNGFLIPQDNAYYKIDTRSINESEETGTDNFELIISKFDYKKHLNSTVILKVNPKGSVTPKIWGE